MKSDDSTTVGLSRIEPIGMLEDLLATVRESVGEAPELNVVKNELRRMRTTQEMHMEDILLGDFVAYDPTGRDLPDCLMVGRVLARVSDTDGSNPRFEIQPNGTTLYSERIRVETIESMVWRNPKRCRFCGEGVVSTKPGVDFCQFCWYNGTFHEEKLAPLLDRLREAFPEASAGVWHTGGGCFTVGVSWPNGSYAYIGDNAYVPEDVDGPTGCWWFKDEDDEEGTSVAENESLATIIERLEQFTVATVQP